MVNVDQTKFIASLVLIEVLKDQFQVTLGFFMVITQSDMRGIDGYKGGNKCKFHAKLHQCTKD